MKRNLGLVRRLLLVIEAESTGDPLDIEVFAETGADVDTISYHILLLRDAGLIETTDAIYGEAYGAWEYYPPIRLTMQGHEFADAARNKTIWRRAVQYVRQEGLKATLGLMQHLLKERTDDLLRIALGG